MLSKAVGLVKSILAVDIYRAEAKIKGAWMAGVASGSVTLVFTLIAMKTNVWGFTISNLGDVLLVFTLAFGIYIRNRACAILMLVYFLVAKVLIWMRLDLISDLPKAVWVGYLLFTMLFCYFFVEGIRGTFAYHRLERQAKSKRGKGTVFKELRKGKAPQEEISCVGAVAQEEEDTGASDWWKL
ncbi:MAG: hypothetical protein ACYSSO_12000 [Planctomycetota bacterium]|jgi:serine/threonine-protein kinase